MFFFPRNRFSFSFIHFVVLKLLANARFQNSHKHNIQDARRVVWEEWCQQIEKDLFCMSRFSTSAIILLSSSKKCSSIYRILTVELLLFTSLFLEFPQRFSAFPSWYRILEMLKAKTSSHTKLPIFLFIALSLGLSLSHFQMWNCWLNFT